MLQKINEKVSLQFFEKKEYLFFATDKDRTGGRRLVFLLLSGPSGY
jgi:hypothetical protein